MIASRPERILTIGAHGFTAERFFNTLIGAQVDLFCDIRARRGMRGAEYAFANSRRLQERLAELSMRYEHIKTLAPSQGMRDAQRDDDKHSRAGKRGRAALGEAFKSRYRQECLAAFDAEEFLRTVVGAARRPVLFCVEREPKACHRSLVAEAIAAQTGLPVEHLSR